MQQTVINGKTYIYIRRAPGGDCSGCAAYKDNKHNSELCDELPDCYNSIWAEVPSSAPVMISTSPYETCMKEYNKYSQYDSVEMDEFERGCIMGRKLQSLKLAKVFKNDSQI